MQRLGTALMCVGVRLLFTRSLPFQVDKERPARGAAGGCEGPADAPVSTQMSLYPLAVPL